MEAKRRMKRGWCNCITIIGCRSGLWVIQKLRYLCGNFQKLKNLISVLLAFLILLQSFSKVWIIFSFKINQDYIARVLCINRDKPEMHCNGNCILMQRIKADEEQEKKDMSQKLKDLKDVCYCLRYFASPSEYLISQAGKQINTFHYQPPITSDFVKGIFHPPNFVTV